MWLSKVLENLVSSLRKEGFKVARPEPYVKTLRGDDLWGREEVVCEKGRAKLHMLINYDLCAKPMYRMDLIINGDHKVLESDDFEDLVPNWMVLWIRPALIEASK